MWHPGVVLYRRTQVRAEITVPLHSSLSPVEQAALHHEGNFPPPAPPHRFAKLNHATLQCLQSNRIFDARDSLDLASVKVNTICIPQERQRERVLPSIASRQPRSAREEASSSFMEMDSPPTTSTSTTRSSETRSGSTTTLRRYPAPHPSRRTGFFRILRLPRLQQLFVVFLLDRVRKEARGINRIEDISQINLTIFLGTL